jgi:hypothetical protein
MSAHAVLQRRLHTCTQTSVQSNLHKDMDVCKPWNPIEPWNYGRVLQCRDVARVLECMYVSIEGNWNNRPNWKPIRSHVCTNNLMCNKTTNIRDCTHLANTAISTIAALSLSQAAFRLCTAYRQHRSATIIANSAQVHLFLKATGAAIAMLTLNT